MYLLFRYHHITPKECSEMGYGEWQVIKAFMHHQVELMNAEIEKMKEQSKG